jgi:hypothetical protein
MKHKYWQDRGRWDASTTPIHEALHAAVGFATGGLCYWIKLYANGEGRAGAYSVLGWKQAAIFLAPALINDISPGDEEFLRYINPHRRGYAWGWLKKNRRKIMRMAKQIRSKMGKKPGRLVWPCPWDRRTVYWVSTRRKR